MKPFENCDQSWDIHGPPCFCLSVPQQVSFFTPFNAIVTALQEIQDYLKTVTPNLHIVQGDFDTGKYPDEEASLHRALSRSVCYSHQPRDMLHYLLSGRGPQVITDQLGLRDSLIDK